MLNTGTSQIFLSAKFHNFAVSGLFFIHKNKRVQFFMKHGVVSGCGYSPGFPEEEASKNNVAIENVYFKCFRRHIFGALENKANVKVIYIIKGVMFVCLSVSLFRMAGQTAGPIDTKLYTRTHVHPGSVYVKVSVKVIHVCVRE